MALTRKFLKAMGIEDEKIDQIIEEHVEVKNDLNAKLEAETRRADENAEKAGTVEALQKQLDELRNGGGNEELAALQKEYEDFKASVEAEKAVAMKRDLYKNLLVEAGIDPKRIETVLKVTDLEGVTVKDGAIEEADKLTEGIKEEWADFVVEKKQQGAFVPNPPNKQLGQVDLESLGMDEYIAARNKQ